MVDYVRVLRSGLCELAMQVAVPNEQCAKTTSKLLGVIRRCLNDSFHTSEVERLNVRHFNVICHHVVMSTLI